MSAHKHAQTDAHTRASAHADSCMKAHTHSLTRFSPKDSSVLSCQANLVLIIFLELFHPAIEQEGTRYTS